MNTLQKRSVLLGEELLFCWAKSAFCGEFTITFMDTQSKRRRHILESLQPLLLLFPSDLIKAFLLGVPAPFAASWSSGPQDGCASFLPSLVKPRHSWVPIPVASGFVWEICGEYDQIAILGIWEFVYDCARDLRFWILLLFRKRVLEFSFCCRYCKGLLSTISFILITELLRHWKHACESSLYF